MGVFNIIAVASLLHHLAQAVPWNEPLPTPQGLLDAAGVSPRPTEAPGLNGIPKELLKRQQNILYPPPDNWCGFIEGDYDNPLSCNAFLTCVNSGTAVGCCPNTRPGCTNVYTTCYDFGSTCDSDCEANDKIRKCSDSEYPYCGTYSFPVGTYLFNCESVTNYGASSVEQLGDFYITAVSSSYNPFTSLSQALSASSASSAFIPTFTPHFTSSASSSTSSSDGGGLSADAIRGIAIGVSLGVCAIFILLAIFIVRKRRANRRKQASQPNLPPAYTPNAPMQQQTNPAYQPVAQHDQQYPPNQAGYFSPPAPGKDGAMVSSQPALSPMQDPNHQHRYSTTNTSLLSPNSTGPGTGSISGRDSAYRNNGVASPTITEVDGSDRPMPEADSIQRPQSTHQGMVSPMQSIHSPGSPPPSNGHFMQQYGNANQSQQPGQGHVQNGYVAPHAGIYEMPHVQPYLGPHEMPNERH